MLYLASQSPRRRQLLEQIGVRFETLDIEIAEVRAAAETPVDYVRRVAREKAAAGIALLGKVPGAVVLAGDTEVVLGDEVFGKPVDAGNAAAMLRRLAGRRHRVLSAVCCSSGGREQTALCESMVEFAPLDDARIAAYVATGEAFGRAGAYAIQGRAAAFVSRLEGSFSGVMGLPLFETAGLLRSFGIDA